jgi:hypothetical protein
VLLDKCVEPLGDRVLESIAQAASSVVLVAPFIKRAALANVLEAVGPDVALSCYTRWRPEEIAAGISDLEAWPLLRERNGSLRLRYDLHAKVFRADDVCFVGSANVTLAALGWTPAANLELLVPIPADHEILAAFFEELDRRTVEVTDAIHAEMLEVVKAFPVAPASHHVTSAEEVLGSLVGWIPRCRVPGNHNLYRTYTKRWNMVNSTTYEDAARDLAALGVPEGSTSELVFAKHVAAVLRQSPVVALVAERAGEPIRPEEGQRLISQELGYGNGPDGEITGEEWTTLRSWITTFLADEFRERQGVSGPELIRGSRIV